MSDPDPRPRPQYGEYASPEEQRARIAKPDVTDALSTGQAPETLAPAAPRATAAPSARATPAGNARLADRIITIALLAYGIVNVAVTAPRIFVFTTFAQDYFSLLGVDAAFTNTSAGAIWGPIASVAYVVGFAFTALVAWRRVRTGRIAFWVPLVGVAVTTLVVGICVAVPLAGDPAFADALRGLSGAN
jgi:hypothetical protein